MLKSHANQLADLKQLSRIHLADIRLINIIPALRSLVHLKTIVLHSFTLEYDLIHSLSDFDDITALVAVPQVEEVQFEYVFDTMCITLLVTHWMNLKRILVSTNRDDNYSPKFNIAMLNRARRKLKNACELTIFTNCEGNSTNLDHELVKLKFVEFEYDCDAHPFQRYCMPSNQ